MYEFCETSPPTSILKTSNCLDLPTSTDKHTPADRLLFPAYDVLSGILQKIYVLFSISFLPACLSHLSLLSVSLVSLVLLLFLRLYVVFVSLVSLVGLPLSVCASVCLSLSDARTHTHTHSLSHRRCLR